MNPKKFWLNQLPGSFARVQSKTETQTETGGGTRPGTSYARKTPKTRGAKRICGPIRQNLLTCPSMLFAFS